MSAARPVNRLAREKSPYLLQHAHNPVDWYAYGEEAFAKARRENKPILLSIGYSTCHWCHVMERESFENPDIAALMNESFVNIKVDREERPDVDQVYMQAVMAMSGQGGWPLNVWLTPDLEPFYGGTYFPPDGRWGRPGFPDVLRGISRSWRERPADVRQNVDQIMGALKGAVGAGEGTGELDTGLVQRAVEDLAGGFDEHHGGFGPAPKFPRPAALSLLAHQACRGAHPRAASMLERTLEMMWRGGIYDHVGGGFARYSTDERWLVPHFEKMLYDNALLTECYLEGHLLTGREDFAEVVRDVLDFVAREMTHEQGGFFSAQDADSEGEEGRFYVFSLEDLAEALGEDAEQAARIYGASAGGNFEGSNILHWPRSLESTAREEGLSLEELRTLHQDLRLRLRGWREQRVRPGLDDKVLTSWNGLMIAALARAGAVLAEPRYVEAAGRAADFVERELRASDGSLLRRWRAGEARFEASLDDHTYLAHGLLWLYQATGEARWLARSLELLEEAERLFVDAEGGGYFFARESPDLIVRGKEVYDGALPSANGMAALVLARLGAALGREGLRERSLETVRAFSQHLERMPEGYPTLLLALVEASEAPRTLHLLGDGQTRDFTDTLTRAHRDLLPGRLVLPVPDAEREALACLAEGLVQQPRAADAPVTALLCEDGSCRPWAGG